MRLSDSATIAALTNAPIEGLVPRNLVWLTCRNRQTGAEKSFGFWEEPLPVTMNVVSGLDGSTVSRLYEGDGGLIGVDKIPLSASIAVRTVTFQLSPAHVSVREAIREYQPHQGRVEIHRVPLDVRSRMLVAAPRCRFVGRIDHVDDPNVAIGDTAAITVECASATGDLTKTNPAKRSIQTMQAQRDSDGKMRYADVAHLWDVLWGEKGTTK